MTTRAYIAAIAALIIISGGAWFASGHLSSVNQQASVFRTANSAVLPTGAAVQKGDTPYNPTGPLPSGASAWRIGRIIGAAGCDAFGGTSLYAYNNGYISSSDYNPGDGSDGTYVGCLWWYPTAPSNGAKPITELMNSLANECVTVGGQSISVSGEANSAGCFTPKDKESAAVKPVHKVTPAMTKVLTATLGKSVK